MTAQETRGTLAQEAAEPYKLMTADEFFDWSDETDTRYELVNGILYAQAGTTRNHGRIVSAVVSIIAGPARQAGCEMQIGSAGLRISDATVYVPDIALICDSSDVAARYFERPCVTIEVLSRSTELIDRREKVGAYRSVDGLLTYLIIHQDAKLIERHWRDDASSPWQLMTYTGGSIPLPCVEIELSLDDLYRDLAVEDVE